MGMNPLSYPSVGILLRKQGPEESGKRFPSPYYEGAYLGPYNILAAKQ